eukprot:g6466.t1
MERSSSRLPFASTVQLLAEFKTDPEDDHDDDGQEEDADHEQPGVKEFGHDQGLPDGDDSESSTRSFDDFSAPSAVSSKVNQKQQKQMELDDVEDQKNLPKINNANANGYTTAQLEFLLSGICNAIATVSNIKGLRHLAGCQYQMFRGARIFFIGLLSLTFLKKKLRWRTQGLGMGLTVLGIIVICLQERIYHEAPQTPPLLAIGIEGCVGVVFLCAVIAPLFCFVLPAEGAQNSQWETELAILKELVVGSASSSAASSEDQSSNATKKIESDSGTSSTHDHGTNAQLPPFWRARILYLAYMLANGGACTLGSQVGKTLSSNGRAILESCRTIVTWGVEVVILKCFTDEAAALARKLDATKLAWWLEKAGFVVLLLGTVVYFEVLCNANKEPNDHHDEEAPGTKAAPVSAGVEGSLKSQDDDQKQNARHRIKEAPIMPMDCGWFTDASDGEPGRITALQDEDAQGSSTWLTALAGPPRSRCDSGASTKSSVVELETTRSSGGFES